MWFWILEPQEKELLRRAELIRADVERFAFLAAHDSLTGLLNRGGFREATALALATAKTSGEVVAFLQIDLDKFKEVNDTLGHPVGDLVLMEVAARLRAAARETDLVARLGGDEFAIVCLGTRDVATIVALGERIVAALAEPIDADPYRAQISASVGIAYYPAHGSTYDDVFAHADRAMYAAKTAGRNCVRLFSQSAAPSRLPSIKAS